MAFPNEGKWDRVIRVLIGIALAYAAWTAWPGAAAVTFLVVATIALVTGFVGWCPTYALFRFSTRRKTFAG